MSSIFDKLLSTARELLLAFGDMFVRVESAVRNIVETVVDTSPEIAFVVGIVTAVVFVALLN